MPVKEEYSRFKLRDPPPGWLDVPDEGEHKGHGEKPHMSGNGIGVDISVKIHYNKSVCWILKKFDAGEWPF